jgi:hypothetical protein
MREEKLSKHHHALDAVFAHYNEWNFAEPIALVCAGLNTK